MAGSTLTRQPLPYTGGTAPGYRDTNTGALSYVGNSGHIWSSTVSGTAGVFLSFSTQYLDPSYVRYRGHGLPLRCLSE